MKKLENIEKQLGWSREQLDQSLWVYLLSSVILFCLIGLSMTLIDS